jgi:hypothetical protein
MENNSVQKFWESFDNQVHFNKGLLYGRRFCFFDSIKNKALSRLSIYCKETLIHKKKNGFITLSYNYLGQKRTQHLSLALFFVGDCGERIKETLKQFCEDLVETLYVNRSDITIVFIKNSHFFNSQPYLLDFCVVICRITSTAKNALSKEELLKKAKARTKILQFIINKFDRFLEIMKDEEILYIYNQRSNGLSTFSAIIFKTKFKEVFN